MSTKFKFPDTGIYRCFDEAGKIIYPDNDHFLAQQDGKNALHPLSFSFLTNNNNEAAKKTEKCVKDNNTGLIWEIKSTKESDINYAENKYTQHEAANDYIDNLNKEKHGGFDDWRLPNKDELRSIIDYGRMNPAINTEYFQNIKIGLYWCANTYQMQDCMGWGIFTGFGSATAVSKQAKQYAIAVRGGYNSEFGKCNNSRFEDNGDGTVSDKTTGLMWQKGDNPRMNWFEALKFCQNFELAGYSDWRLPNIKELNTILNLNRTDGWWYYKDFFPVDNLVPPLLHYFSSSIFNGDFVWVTNFNYGYDGYYAGKMSPLLFRAVRNIEERPATPAFKLPDTGQIKCFDDKGNYLKSTKNSLFEGQDGDFVIHPVSYKKAGYGGIDLDDSLSPKNEWLITKDVNTGLMWEIKSDKNEAINPVNEIYNLNEAYEFIDKLNKYSYGGFSDWRMPNREELRSIVLYNDEIPAIDTQFFPDTQTDFYWSNNNYAPNKNMQWGIYFGYGCSICYSNHKFYPVRAVRGGFNPGFGNPMHYNLIVNNDKTVSDVNSGLMWMQNDPGEMSLTYALSYCKKLDLGGYNDWRLPSMKEITTLIHLSCPDGNWYNKEVFADIKTKPLGFYWSSSVFMETFGWGVNFQFGYDGYYADRINGKYCFKPVRNINKHHYE
ncbi:MAG: DUF1566 domain-containing protein [Prolixibacteraceae bacterium]|nr:DUF1566 domain-containing protein [Prolixibacteraceae bacterium]MBN2650149.1 DUF1566 domain-containing protein [Prolixibacteraceae bacterium]